MRGHILRNFARSYRKACDLDGDQLNEIVALLKVDAFPLIEKALLLLFYRQWPASIDGALLLARQLSEEARDLIVEGKKKNPGH